MVMSLTRTCAFFLLFVLLAGCERGGQHGHSDPVVASADESAVEHALRHLDPTYVCPMHPQIVRNEPGSCPICGMALVQREARPATRGELPEIDVDGRLRQALGLRSAEVTRRSLSTRVQAPGQVIVDENRIGHVHARASGWVEVLNVHAVGEPVRSGQVLLELYSPELVSAQEDYLIALRQGGPDGRSERSAAVRLRQLGVDDAFIDALRESRQSNLRVPVRATQSGVLTELNVRHGMYVERATVVMEITDLSQVWIRVDVFAEQLTRLGDEISGAFRMVGMPGRVWRGSADYIYPEIDALTQTIHVRFPVPNRQGLLRIGAFVDATLSGTPREDVLVVPHEAVIRVATGARVLLDLGDGRFRPVPVTLGQRFEHHTEIRRGLREGARVVVSGQFLLDSESALRAGLDRVGEGSTP